MRKAILPIAALLVAAQLAAPAFADNKMGYTLVTQRDAMNMPKNGGGLGMDIAAAERIQDSGMTFDLIRVKSVLRGSPGAKAGMHAGDEIIAVDGQVFESLRAFASYIGAVQPGQRVQVDYIPNGGGPKDAQRVAIEVGGGNGKSAPRREEEPEPKQGMSTGKKVAIGVGAAALLGCYELGCFSHRNNQQR